MLAPRALIGGGVAVIMARKRKTAKSRLREAIERARGPRPIDLLPKTDYSDERTREIGANIALALSDDPIDASLRQAFNKFGLDPSNPWNWRYLLDTFADIHFSTDAPPAPRRGPRRKWDFDLFDRHVEWARARTKKLLKRRGEPGPTHNDVALYLKIALAQYYGSFNQETLRTYIIKRQPKG
jgi:hypothetical protein